MNIDKSNNLEELIKYECLKGKIRVVNKDEEIS